MSFYCSYFITLLYIYVYKYILSQKFINFQMTHICFEYYRRDKEKFSVCLACTMNCSYIYILNREKKFSLYSSSNVYIRRNILRSKHHFKKQKDKTFTSNSIFYIFTQIHNGLLYYIHVLNREKNFSSKVKV